MTRARYDIIAIDLDGTLLNREGAVSHANRRALQAARDAGIEVIIATGRAWIESRHVLESIGHDGVFIGAGGATLNHALSGETIRRHVMDPSLAVRIAQSLIRHGHLAHLLKDGPRSTYDYLIVGEGELDPATQWWFRSFPVRARFAESLELDDHPQETLRCGTVAVAGDLRHVVDELREDLGNRVFMQHWAAVTESQAVGAATHLLEVFNPRVDKWTMLSEHAEERGVPVERIAAIGDGLNDVGMVRQAGLGVAVGNADPRVRDAADRHAPDHDHDGVAHAIEHILRGAW